jgi:CubicO group peptidase (beta-lactamase class C family)
MKLYNYITLFLIFNTTNLFAIDENTLGELKKELNEILLISKAPGFSVAIVKGNKVVFAEGFGYRDLENRELVNSKTIFPIASSTKSFTASLVGIAEDKGLLKINSNPQNYLPNLKFINNELNNYLTIEDLLSHRTGLPRHDYSWFYFPTKNRDSLIKRIQYLEPTYGLRNQWQYNNFMYFALGEIVSKVTNKTWDINIQEDIFKPLNMTSSYTNINEIKDNKNIALGYITEKEKNLKIENFYNLDIMSPAGGIYSNVIDMSNWLITWLNKGKYNDQQLFSLNYYNQAMMSHSIITNHISKDFIKMNNYGYGWFISSYYNHLKIHHGGNLQGFSSDVAFYPNDDIGIVVLVNQEDSKLTDIVINVITDKILKLKTEDWFTLFKQNEENNSKNIEKLEANKITAQIKNTNLSHNKADYEGVYYNAGYGEFEISLINDSLFLISENEKLVLSHYHYDTFEPISQLDKPNKLTSFQKHLKIHFLTNEMGDISALQIKLESLLKPILFEKIRLNLKTETLNTNEYIGNYKIANQTFNIFTKNDNTLYMLVKGQPEYQLIFHTKNKFKVKGLDGFSIEFNNIMNNVFTEVLLLQPQGNFKAIRSE